MTMYEPGDVLCYDRDPEEQVWLFVLGGRFLGMHCGVQLKGKFAGCERQMIVTIAAPDNRSFTYRRIVPPEEWPDDICAAVATYKLTGEVS